MIDVLHVCNHLDWGPEDERREEDCDTVGWTMFLDIVPGGKFGELLGGAVRDEGILSRGSILDGYLLRRRVLELIGEELGWRNGLGGDRAIPSSNPHL